MKAADTLTPDYSNDSLAIYLRSELRRDARREAEIMGVSAATGLQLPEGMNLPGLIAVLQSVELQVEDQMATYDQDTHLSGN